MFAPLPCLVSLSNLILWYASVVHASTFYCIADLFDISFFFFFFVLTFLKASDHTSVVVVLVTHSCLTLYDPMDCSPPGFSVQGILQARILEWIAIPFSRGSSWPRDWPWVSCIAGRFFTVWTTREAPVRQHWILRAQPSANTLSYYAGISRQTWELGNTRSI